MTDAEFRAELVDVLDRIGRHDWVRAAVAIWVYGRDHARAGANIGGNR